MLTDADWCTLQQQANRTNKANGMLIFGGHDNELPYSSASLKRQLQIAGVQRFSSKVRFVTLERPALMSTSCREPLAQYCIATNSQCKYKYHLSLSHDQHERLAEVERHLQQQTVKAMQEAW